MIAPAKIPEPHPSQPHMARKEPDECLHYMLQAVTRGIEQHVLPSTKLSYIRASGSLCQMMSSGRLASKGLSIPSST